MHDALGNIVTCASPAALGAYERAVDAQLHAWPGALQAVDEAIALDPGFALAHALRALPLSTYGPMAEARAAAARAVALAGSATEREQAHAAVIAAAVDGRSSEALERVYDHARRWPTDAVAVGTALGAFGLLAFSGRLDHDAARLALVESIAPHYPADHAWLLAHRGWVRIEAGRVDEGMSFARRSLAARAANGNIAHVVMHGHFEAHEPQAALTFIEGWLPGYPDRAVLWGHLHWHAALAFLELGQPEAALARLLGPLGEFEAKGAPFMVLTDTVSLGWRLGLRGLRNLPWDRATALAARHYATGSNVFGELHLAMLAAVRRDATSLDACVQRLRAIAERGHAGATPALHWTAGLAALMTGDRKAADQALAACRAELARVGGSHAQRSVVESTHEAMALPEAC
jgi:hypothetical protein